MIRPNPKCQSDHRRNLVAADPSIGGLDFLEVISYREIDASIKKDLRWPHPSDDSATVLKVHLLGKSPILDFTTANVRITGGRRIKNLQVLAASLSAERQSDERLDDLLYVLLNGKGDASQYDIGVVDLSHGGGRLTPRPHPRFDPRFSELSFTFSQGLPSEFDCKTESECPPVAPSQPELDYLAKDYDSFRQLILDRFATLMPQWRERSAADFGVMMVELLAYVGDHLSYQQDAVATEAYLGTARQRISVRRHARLVDYSLHDGCNARCWVCIETEDDLEFRPSEILFLTDPGIEEPKARVITGAGTIIADDDASLCPPSEKHQLLNEDDLETIGRSHFEPFEPLQPAAQSPQFKSADVKLPATLAMRVKHSGKGSIAHVLKDRLSPLGRQLLEQYRGDEETHGQPPYDLQVELIEAMNLLLQSASIPDRVFGKLIGDATGNLDMALIWRNRRRIEKEFPSWVLANRNAPEHLVISSTLGIDNPKIRFRKAQNCMAFHTWGESECCLHRGATHATLQDAYVPVGISPTGSGNEPRHENDWYERERRLSDLQPGDVLLIEEVKGRRTGAAADADVSRRHAVRLTQVRFDVDPMDRVNADGNRVGTDFKGESFGRPIVEIEWAVEDALPFPMTISAVLPEKHCQLESNITIARGNVLLVDHGETLASAQPLGKVSMQSSDNDCEGVDRPGEISMTAARFSPTLSNGPLTFSEPLQPELSATRSLEQNIRSALPDIKLKSIPAGPDGLSPIIADDCDPSPLAGFPEVRDPDQVPGSVEIAARVSLVQQLRAQSPGFKARTILNQLSDDARQWLSGFESDPEGADAAKLATIGRKVAAYLDWDLLESWSSRADLLDSGPRDRHFVTETDQHGHAHLRFGDGKLGRQPAAGEFFLTRYRIGNGPQGNVGAETIVRMAKRGETMPDVRLAVRNPLPASGGTAPESMEEAKLLAPGAFRNRLVRAVTPDDYARMVEQQFPSEVQRAAATRKWTGCSEEIQVSVDPRDANAPSDALLSRITQSLQSSRRIGHTVRVRGPVYVPLEIELCIRVNQDSFRAEVKRSLLSILSARVLADGRRGFFHPDNQTFGDNVRMSELVARVQSVTGVQGVDVLTFKRLNLASAGELEEGVIRLHSLEIARLDNDPDFPENGVLRLQMEGGR